MPDEARGTSAVDPMGFWWLLGEASDPASTAAAAIRGASASKAYAAWRLVASVSAGSEARDRLAAFDAGRTFVAAPPAPVGKDRGRTALATEVVSATVTATDAVGGGGGAPWRWWVGAASVAGLAMAGLGRKAPWANGARGRT